jgi:Tol biopolymer transport system component
MNLSPGQVIHTRYRIVRLLGQGGFGAVYRAYDMTLRIPCAVKENFELSAEAQGQFEREALLLAALRHPNLPRVTDHFTVEGQGQYLVMDFVDGEDLQSYLERMGQPLDEAQALKWVGQVCDALDYIHHQDPPIIHRDIKPANIRITPAGQAMLVDFGIAKVFSAQARTTAGARAVTPGYSPPEQYGLGGTDPRSDIYSLGATLYTLLTGLLPQESVQRTLHDRLEPVTALNPGVSPAVSSAITMAMSLRPELRFQTAADLEEALNASGPFAAGAVSPGMQTTFVSPASSPAVSPTLVAPVAAAAGPAAAAGGEHMHPIAAPPPDQSRPWAKWLLGASALVVILVIVGLLLLFPGGQNQVTQAATGIAFPAGELYFTSDRSGETEIYRMDQAGTSQFTRSPVGSNSWSPVLMNAGTLLFVSDRSGKREIYFSGAGGVRQLTVSPGASESWAPCPEPGGTILFTSNRDGRREVYRLAGDGVKRLTVTPGNGESWAAVPEPAGSLVFTSNRHGKMELYRLAAGAEARLTNTPGNGESWGAVPYQDGSLLFISNRDGKNEIYRIGEDGIRRLTNTPGSAASWSPFPLAGAGFAFTSDRDGKPEVYYLLNDAMKRVTFSPGTSASWISFQEY